MSNLISIKAACRDEFGTACSRRLRRAGLVPAVVYSHGQPAIPVTISAADAELVANHTGLLELANEAKGETMTAVVKEVQRHPLTVHILHIDFQAVKADEIIESVVEIEGMGDAIGTRSGGQLEQVLFDVTIKSKPTEVPEKITVDVSGIDVDQALHVKDIVAPAGVEIVTDPELVVFHVRAVKEEAAASEGEEKK